MMDNDYWTFIFNLELYSMDWGINPLTYQQWRKPMNTTRKLHWVDIKWVQLSTKS